MRGRILLGAVLLAGALYFALFGGEYSWLELRRIRQDRTEEEDRLARERVRVDSLQARVDSLETDSATLERIARDRWGLIRDGERLYRFVDGDTVEVDSLGHPVGKGDTLPAAPAASGGR